MLKHNQPDNDAKQAEFKRTAQEILDNSLGQLGATTQSRLQAIRRNAIEQGLSKQGLLSKGSDKYSTREKVQSEKWPRWVLPASGFASLALVVVLSIGLWQQAGISQNMIASIEDIPLLTATDDLELYEELEFYQWLAEDQNAG